MPEPKRCSPRIAFLLVALLVPLKVFSDPSIVTLATTVPEGTYPAAVSVLFSADDPSSSCWYRFMGGNSSWFRCDRYLVLDASLREERRYEIEVEARKSGSALARKVFTYTIDRKPPSVPVADRKEERAILPFRLNLSSEPGTSIVWSSPSSGSREFRKWTGELVLTEIDGLTDYFSCVAYSVDASGNASRPVTFRWLLSQPGPRDWIKDPPAVKPTDPVVFAPGESPPVSEDDSGFRLAFKTEKNDDSILVCVRQNQLEPPVLDDFSVLTCMEGTVDFYVPVPRGWSETLAVFWGIKSRDGSVTRFENPVELHGLRDARTRSVPETVLPSFTDDNNGGLVLSFPDHRNPIEYKTDKGNWISWTAPVPLIIPGGGKTVLAWRQIDGEGIPGREFTETFDFPPRIEPIDVFGILPGAVTASKVLLSPKSDGTVRFESTRDGTVPREVTDASPILVPLTPFDVPPGSTGKFMVRYRTFGSPVSGSAFSGERLLPFIVDREQPSPPMPSEDSVAGFAQDDRTVTFSSSDGDIFYQTTDSRGGKSGELPYTGPILLKAPEEGRITHTIMARARDRAGNFSAWSKPIVISLDKSSVYVSEFGDEGGTGTPTKPYGTLDDAVFACMKSGKRVIYVHGNVSLRQPMVIDSSIAVSGGYSRDFVFQDGNPSVITFTRGFSGTPFTVGSGSSLAFEKISAEYEPADKAPFALVSGRLSLARSFFGYSPGANGEFIVSRGGRIEVADSTISIRKGVTVSAFFLEGGSLTLASSSVESGRDVMFASPLRSSGTLVSIAATRFALAATGGVEAVTADGGSLLVSGSVFKLSGSEGFANVFVVRNATIKVENCIVESVSSGPCTLFDAKHSEVALYHGTLNLGSLASSVQCFLFEDSGLEAINTIFVSGGDSVFAEGKFRGISFLTNYVTGFARLSNTGETAALIQAGTVPNSSTVPFIRDGKGLPVLYALSPCVDSGSFIKTGLGSDFDGKPRNDGKPDLGAIEFFKQ